MIDFDQIWYGGPTVNCADYRLQSPIGQREEQSLWLSRSPIGYMQKPFACYERGYSTLEVWPGHANRFHPPSRQECHAPTPSAERMESRSGTLCHN
jgi:hypothetical protein